MASHDLEAAGKSARLQRRTRLDARAERAQVEAPLPAIVERGPRGLLAQRRIGQLQHLVGNTATSQLLRDSVQRAVIQRSPWAGATSAAGGLSTQLQDGLTLAKANPNALAAKPAWLLARCQAEITHEFTTNQATYQNEFGTKWDNDANIQKRFKRDDFINQRMPGQLAMMLKGAATRVKQRTGEQKGVAVDDQFKWNVTFNNLDGDLPGVKGGGGYREYYAEPDPADSVSAGFWGRNRILLCTENGPHKDSWWATADHYQTSSRSSED